MVGATHLFGLALPPKPERPPLPFFAEPSEPPPRPQLELPAGELGTPVPDLHDPCSAMSLRRPVPVSWSAVCVYDAMAVLCSRRFRMKE